MLTGGDNISNYREVTASERNRIETAEASFVPPSDVIVRQWKEYWHLGSVYLGSYNSTTGYFEVGHLTDITNDEALRIMTELGTSGGLVGGVNLGSPLRALRPARMYNGGGAFSIRYAYSYCYKLEVIALTAANNSTTEQLFRPSDASFAFFDDGKLKTIIGLINLSLSTNVDSMFGRCYALENVSISKLKSDISFSDSPKLAIATLEYLIDKAANTKAITVTLHPDAYARLTDELIAKAADKLITFATS